MLGITYNVRWQEMNKGSMQKSKSKGKVSKGTESEDPLPRLVQVRLSTFLPSDWETRRKALLGENDNEVANAFDDNDDDALMPELVIAADRANNHADDAADDDDHDDDLDRDNFHDLQNDNLTHIMCYSCSRARFGRVGASGEVRCMVCRSTSVRVRNDDSPPPLELISPPVDGPAAGGGRGDGDVFMPVIVPRSLASGNDVFPGIRADVADPHPHMPAPQNMNPYQLVSGYLGPSDANSNSLANILQQIVLGNIERNNVAAQPGAERRLPPASPQLLAALSRVTVTEQNLSSLGSNGECYISQEAFEVGETCVVLPCSHGYKQDGIVRWLRIHNTCPVCRAVPAPTQTPDPLYDDMPPLIRSRVGRLDADSDEMFIMPTQRPAQPSPLSPSGPGSEFDDLPPLVPEPGVQLIETDAGTWSFMQ